jgi:hypothetical protein
MDMDWDEECKIQPAMKEKKLRADQRQVDRGVFSAAHS